MEHGLNYPIVFVHGMFGWGEDVSFSKAMPYWGATCGSLTKALRDKGVDCCAASVGPASSAWDQACELYAQLTGTRVDYGKAHSKKYGHKRFGRVEKPILRKWDESHKVHLVGHSFGGTCIRLLCHLLEYGAPEEIEAGDDASPLFTGGKGEYVASVTALCSPMGDIDTYAVFEEKNYIPFVKKCMAAYTGTLGRSPLNGKAVDFRLEQFGLTHTPGKKDALPKKQAKEHFKSSRDNIVYDLSPRGIDAINERVRTVDSICYFSYSFNALGYSPQKQRDTIQHTHFIGLRYSTWLLLKYSHKMGVFTGNGNDGLVNVSAATHPPREKWQDYDGESQPQKGVWNVLPTKNGDHGTPIGMFVPKKELYGFYDNLLSLLKMTE